MHLCMGKILEIGVAAFRREEDVALTPEDNGLRLMVPQERLPLGIKLNVGPVVVEEIKLDALGVWKPSLTRYHRLYERLFQTGGYDVELGRI